MMQTTLQSRDEEYIRCEVGELLDELWAGRGGPVAGSDSDSTSIGLEPHWQAIASDEF